MVVSSLHLQRVFRPNFKVIYIYTESTNPSTATMTAISKMECNSWIATAPSKEWRWTWYLIWAELGIWTGEGNGNPLQYSCLENPVDSGAWWAAVYGVAHSQTRLKWLSSSSRHLKSALTFKWGLKQVTVTSISILV